MTEEEVVKIVSRLNMIEFDLIKRILSRRVIKDNGCWEFQGKQTDGGYGSIKYMGKRVTVHRVFFKIIKPEEYKEELLACHKCNNRLCFKPDINHVYMGTPLNNYEDAVLAKTTVIGIKQKQTHCINGHEFTKESVIINKTTGQRQCKICNYKLQEKYRARRVIEEFLKNLNKK